MSGKKKERPRHLGRGLQSLISPIIPGDPGSDQIVESVTISPNLPPDKELRDSLREIGISSISANPYEVRTVWDEQELADLAESIKANGVIQPVIVRRSGTGYELIAGERRFRAAQLASLLTIPALVREATDEQRDHHWDLIGDHSRNLAERTQQCELVVRRPACHNDRQGADRTGSNQI